MNRHDLTILRVEMGRLRERIEALERAQGDRRWYEPGAETEAVRWRAACLARELRRVAGDESTGGTGG